MSGYDLAPHMYYHPQEDLGINDLGYWVDWVDRVDLGHWLSHVDLKTAGVVTAAVVAVVVLVLDLLTKSYAVTPSLATPQAARTTPATPITTTSPYTQHYHPVPGSRSLEPLTKVLSALAAAVAKWEDSGAATATHPLL